MKGRQEMEDPTRNCGTWGARRSAIQENGVPGAGLKPGGYRKDPFDWVAGAAVHCNYELDLRAPGGI